jgi:hypothetical protein
MPAAPVQKQEVQPAGRNAHGSYRFNTIDALMPPKPKEFERAVLGFAWMA